MVLMLAHLEFFFVFKPEKRGKLGMEDGPGSILHLLRLFPFES